MSRLLRSAVSSKGAARDGFGRVAVGSNTVPANQIFGRHLGGAGRGGLIEHGPDDSRVLLTVAAFAKLAAELGGADRRDGLDSMVGGGGGDYVAARGADTQR